MTNFIYDNGTLPYPKTNLVAVPGGADLTKYVQDTDWNAVCQALMDVQNVLRGAEWIGVSPQTDDPTPVGIANYLWVDGTTLKLSIGGASYPIATGTTGVVPGSYTLASITVDDQGRVTAASSGSAMRSLKYTATGTEANSGADFDIPVTPAMSTANYGIAWGPAGILNVPLLDLPDGVGDRTTTKFRVLVGGTPLAAGEVLEFFLIPR